MGNDEVARRGVEIGVPETQAASSNGSTSRPVTRPTTSPYVRAQRSQPFALKVLNASSSESVTPSPFRNRLWCPPWPTCARYFAGVPIGASGGWAALVAVSAAVGVLGGGCRGCQVVQVAELARRVRRYKSRGHPRSESATIPRCPHVSQTQRWRLTRNPDVPHEGSADGTRRVI